MEHDSQRKVQLDGAAIRRIREKQKLTQFYIAKVVGVTTDTVSRWENNRYPSVRRDNAVLLAEALEVPVEEILLDTDTVASGEDRARSPLFIYSVVFSVLIVAAVSIIYYFSREDVVNYQLTVERLLPPHASVATPLPVRVSIETTGVLDGMVLRENFPPGFKLIEADPIPSSLDNVNGSARWIIQAITEPLLVSYLLQPDPTIEPGDNLLFQGELIVNAKGKNKTSRILGETSIPVDIFHWADANRDLVIDDGEALDASVTSMAMKKVHVDWELVESIWDAGGYRFDGEALKFIPVRNQRGE